MKTKPKGGRGYANEARNEAIVVLHKVNKKKFGPRHLGRIFELEHPTVLGILKRDFNKYTSVGVIHS